MYTVCIYMIGCIVYSVYIITWSYTGSVVPVAARDPGKFQHQGYGTLLMEEAERIAREEHGGYMVCIPP